MKLDYRIVYSRRKTIGVTVERDAAVVVHAPIGASEAKVRGAVEAKRFWLYQKVHHKQKYPGHISRKEFVTGTTLLYLGKSYRLEITKDDTEGLQFHSGFYIARHHRSEAGKLLRDWYIERAQRKLPQRAEAIADALGVTFNSILISDLRVRWGSCTPKNNLNFNWRLMKAPTFVIDYVIAHELAHLLEPNHTARFWNIVSVQVPRYQAAKEWLKENGRFLEEEF